MAKILKRDDAIDIENVDEGVANKWRWQWVEKTVDVDLSKYPKIRGQDAVTICLKDCIRKIDQCGKTICLLGRKTNPMKYGTNGEATLTKHVQSFGHVQREVEKLTSYKIPGSGAARDFDLSADLLKRLEFLCYYIGLTFRKPPNYVASQSMVVGFGCLHSLFVHA